MHFPMGHNCAIVNGEAKKGGKIRLDNRPYGIK